MPRLVVNVGESEAVDVAGLQVKAVIIRGRGRRIRVVIDVPPGWSPHGPPPQTAARDGGPASDRRVCSCRRRVHA